MVTENLEATGTDLGDMIGEETGMQRDRTIDPKDHLEKKTGKTVSFESISCQGARTVSQ